MWHTGINGYVAKWTGSGWQYADWDGRLSREYEDYSELLQAVRFASMMREIT